MAFVLVDDPLAANDPVVMVVAPKAGSSSMRYALGKVPHLNISIEEAATYDNIIMFLRDPIERVNSLFNMFWRYALNNSRTTEFMPDTTIKAYGGRVKGGVGSNEHHWTPALKSEYDTKLTLERASTPLDGDLILSLNNQDYERFIDFILANPAADDHWGSQVELATHNRVFLPTTVHPLSDLNLKWTDYVKSPIPQDNSWPAVSHDVYRLAELQTLYAKDIALMGTL